MDYAFIFLTLKCITWFCSAICWHGFILLLFLSCFSLLSRRNHRMVEVVSYLCKSACPTALLKQGHLQSSAPCPNNFWISPRRETPQPLWATCDSAQSPSQQKSVSWCSDRTCCVSVFAHCLLSFHWALGAEPVSRVFLTAIYWCIGLFLPQHRTFHFPLLNFMRWLSAHFSSLWMSLWMAAQLSDVSDTPLSFVSANMVRVLSAPSSLLLIQMLNGIGPVIDTWGTPLLASN